MTRPGHDQEKHAFADLSSPNFTLHSFIHSFMHQAIRIRLPWEVATRARISLALERHTPCSYSTKASTSLWPLEPQTPSGHLPLTGLFAVNKPAGISSTTILDLIQYVCQRNKTNPLVKGALELDNSKRAKRGLVKIGHGGTLDPLARGVVGESRVMFEKAGKNWHRSRLMPSSASVVLMSPLFGTLF